VCVPAMADSCFLFPPECEFPFLLPFQSTPFKLSLTLEPESFLTAGYLINPQPTVIFADHPTSNAFPLNFFFQSWHYVLWELFFLVPLFKMLPSPRFNSFRFLPESTSTPPGASVSSLFIFTQKIKLFCTYILLFPFPRFKILSRCLPPHYVRCCSPLPPVFYIFNLSKKSLQTPLARPIRQVLLFILLVTFSLAPLSRKQFTKKFS